MDSFARHKQARIRAVMDAEGLDVLIASLPENIYYLSGYQSMSQRILSRADAFCLYDRGKDGLSLVLPCSEVPTASEQLGDATIFCYGTFFFHFPETFQDRSIQRTVASSLGSPILALMKAIRETGVKKGSVGLDEAKVRPKAWDEISAAFPDLNIVPASESFSRIRMIKDQEEVARLEKAAWIAEESLFAVAGSIRPGITESEIGDLYAVEVTKRGGSPLFHVITADHRSAFVDTINTRNPVREGSIIRFDVGCTYACYRSDMARTAVLGKPSRKLRDYYAAILEGEEKAIAQIRPGVSGEKIFEAALNGVRRGMPQFHRHHCGHGIGLEVYDPPSIAPGVKDLLDPGMVLCIETPYYELGWGGVQVEDTVVVTETGSRYLTRSSRDLICLDAGGGVL